MCAACLLVLICLSKRSRRLSAACNRVSISPSQGLRSAERPTNFAMSQTITATVMMMSRFMPNSCFLSTVQRLQAQGVCRGLLGYYAFQFNWLEKDQLASFQSV